MKHLPISSLNRRTTHGDNTLTHNTFNRSVLAFAVAGALTSVAHAESNSPASKQLPTVHVEADAETNEGYKPSVSTSYKHTQPLLDTAKTITVISKDVMQDRGVENLRDALRNVPGISLAAGEGGAPTGDNLNIRGFNASTDILIDGIRDIAGYTRDTYNVEAVEISKGPGGAVSGRGATGGSINLQTKTAKLDDISEIGASTGTANDYRMTLDTNKIIGDSSALRFNLLIDDGDVAGRDYINNSSQAAAVNFTTGIDSASRLSISADIQKQDNLPDYGLPWVSAGQDSYIDELAADAGGAPSVDYSNFYGNLYRDFEEIDAHSLTVKYERDLSSTTQLRAQARTGEVNRLSIVTAPRFIDVATSTDVRLSDEKTRDTKNSLNVIQFDLIGKYLTGNIQHDLVVGIEIAKEKEMRWNYDDIVINELNPDGIATDNLDTTPELVDLYNPNPRVNYTGTYLRDGTSTEATGDTIALYAFDTLTFNPHWELTLGARYEQFKTVYQASYTDPTLILNAKESLFNWNTAVVYKPVENGSFYIGAGNSFNPSSEDLTASTSGNNSDLEPEKTISYELGTKWELLDGKLLTNAALFRTEKNNARTDAPDGLFGDDDGRFDTLNGEQRVDGLELGAYGEINKDISITAAYTYQKSEVLKANADDAAQQGNALPRTPEHAVSLWANYMVNEKWTLGAGAQYTSARYNSSDELTREKADAYSTIDFMVGYTVSASFNLQLNGTNLTNTQYEDQLGGGHFIPGEERHLRLSANYNF